MNRRRAFAAVVFSAFGFAVACSFPDVTYEPGDGGGPDGTLSDGPIGDGGPATDAADGSSTGEGGSVTIDSSGPCPDEHKRCGVACTSIYDPTHGCGAAPPACDPCPGPSHTASTCTFPDASCKAACDDPWVDCDNNLANGCEANLDAGDGQNCGACGKTCDAGTFCVGSTCAASCGDAGQPCGTSCVDPTKDPKNCGGCGKTCDAGVNQTPSCQNSACKYKCAEGWGDCDNQPGCEAKLGSVDTCGSCTNKCYGGPHTGASCEDGGCVYGCLTGYSDCNADLSDGCECNGGLVCPGLACSNNSDCCGGKKCQTAGLLPCLAGLICTCR